MPQGQLGSLLQHLRRLIGGPAADAPDAQLLSQFLDQQDETAFAALVARHGPLVLGVCRRVLHDPHAAEDVFQATFMVLAKRAGAIQRPEALSSWLYGVAYRVAARARFQAKQRQVHETQVPAMSRAAADPERDPLRMDTADPLSDASRRELRSVLDEELNLLPEKYRMPMVLCYLEGKTNEEAAQQLRWTKGTVSGRLARARDLLRDRLARRGFALSLAALTGVLSQELSSASVAAGLAATTAQVACGFAAGRALTTAGSVQAASLAQGVLTSMLMTKIKWSAAAFLAFCVLASGTTVLAAWTWRLVQPNPAIAVSATPLPELPKPADTATQVPKEVDPKRFAEAPVVLRVRLHKSAAEVRKYGWDEVEILHVLKNTSGQKFDQTLLVAFSNVKSGVPAGVSTIYLEAYGADQPNHGHWKLLKGGAPEGVSHVVPPDHKHGSAH
jgi:RNA polymerase sigma factor (sigma-70 family)